MNQSTVPKLLYCERSEIKILQKNRFIPATILTIVAAIWGVGFIAMKTTLARIDVYSFLAWRFSIATLLLIIFRPSALKKINSKFLFKGLLVGLFLGSGYIFQSLGLTKTTVGKTGFITGLYVVFTPLVAYVLLRTKVSRWDWFSTLLAALGLGLLSFNGISVGVGETLVLISAFLFAIHIIALGHWASDMDIYALTITQLGACALLTSGAALINGFRTPSDKGVWSAVIFTAIFATAIAFIIQTWAQSFMPATTVAVILTLESVFAAIFGVIVLNESLTFRIGTGGLLVLIAMYTIIIMDGRKKKFEVTYHD